MTNLNERCPNSTRSRLRKRGENQQLPTETTFAKQPSVPPTRRSEPASITTPPAPHKPDVAPAKTGIVIGDSMAEWLAYGLEQAYAESADVGVVRKVRQSTGPRAQEAPAVVQEGPGYAQEGSGVVPRSSKPSARGSSRKPGVDALARSRNASARTAPGRPGNCSLVETLRARAEGERPIQSPGWTAGFASDGPKRRSARTLAVC